MTGNRLRLLSANPDFGRFWIGQALSALGSSISGIALPLLVLHLTGSAVAAGALFTVRLVVLNLARLPGGVLADRFSRRRVMYWTDAAKAVLWATPILLISCSVRQLWPLLVVAVLDGLISAVYNPSLGAALRRLVKPDELLSAVSLNEARSYAAGLIGPSIGGALFAVADWSPFAVDAVTYAVCAVLAYRIRTDLGGHIPAQAGMVAEIRTGFRFVFGHPFLRAQTLWSTLLNFATSAAFFGLIPVLQHERVSASVIGLMSGLLSAGALAGSMLAPRIAAHRPYATLLGCGVVMVLAAAIAAVSTAPAVLTAGLLLLSATGPVLIVLLTSHVYQAIPDELMARAQSSMLLFGSAIFPFSAITMGFVLEHGGARTAYLAVGVCLLGCLALCLPSSIRNQLEPPEEAPSPEREAGLANQLAHQE